MTATHLCTISAGGFLMVGLVSGVWKFACIARTADARAPVYVDIAHRASLMYAFACALLAQLTASSAWSNAVNVVTSAVVIAFFALAVLGYLIHGALRDTDNQLARPHRLGAHTVPGAVMLAWMAALIAGEVGGVAVIFTGYLAGHHH